MSSGYNGNTESEIVKFYEDKAVFITGATGYLGKCVLEKLLRTCNTLKKVFLLVREKKGIGRKERFDEIFSSEMWKHIQEENTNFKDKVFLIEGDLLKPNLGLSNESIETLKNEVNIIFHCAASVRFDQHIRSAAYINTRSVRDLMEISRGMKKLDVFVHVSTAYSNSMNTYIDEKIYKPPVRAQELLQFVELFDEGKLSELTKTLLGEWPNTYTYTKCATETMIAENMGELPMVICRPAIITGAITEPLPGWVDNFYGPSGIILGVSLGIIRALRVRTEFGTSMVPSDYVTNWMIAAAYDFAARTRSQNVGVPVYNYCSPPDKEISIEMLSGKTGSLLKKYAPMQCVWMAMLTIQTCVYHNMIMRFLLHTVPAYIIDFVLMIIGKPAKAVETYEKVHNALDAMDYFVNKKWNFGIENTTKLWNRLNSQDQNLFPFSMENFDLNSYFDILAKGLRLYLLKEPMNNLREGKKKQIKLKIMHYTLSSVLIILGYFFFRFIFNFMLKIFMKLMA